MGWRDPEEDNGAPTTLGRQVAGRIGWGGGSIQSCSKPAKANIWGKHPVLRLPWWLRWQRIHLQCRRPGFDPWVGKVPWRKEWQPTPVFLPGESHGRGAWRATVHGVAKNRTQLGESNTHTHTQFSLILQEVSAGDQKGNKRATIHDFLPLRHGDTDSKELLVEEIHSVRTRRFQSRSGRDFPGGQW